MSRIGLVVDDDVPSRKIYCSLLKSLGIQAAEAGDGVQAMAYLEANAPEIVFLDIRLPKVNGLEILSYIYQAPHLQATRVVIVTAHSNYREEIALRDGDLYLVKPISPTEIREMVTQSSPHRP